MPIYEYGCPDCGQRIEHMQKISDPLLSTCPQCGSTKIRKLVSQTSFSLKGSGWYSDHYGLRSGSDSGSKSKVDTSSSDSSSSSSAAVKSSAPSGSDSGSSGSSSGGSAPPASGGSSPAGGSSASATG